MTEEAVADPTGLERLAERLRWLPYAIVAVGALTMFAQTVEDPFIVLRYADNLRHGHGLVFNPGDRVEGFTSPLHVLVALVALELPGGVPLLWLKLASLLFGVLAVHEVARLTRTVGGRGVAPVIAQLVVAGNLAWWTVSANGLETTLWCFALLRLTRLVVDDTRSGGWRRSTGAAVLALLVRPDMVVIAPAIVVGRLWVRRAKADRAAVARFAACFAGVVVAITAARLAYYGRPLPNTYYAKAAGLATAVRAGFAYLLDGVGTDVIARERSSGFRLVGILANVAWALPAALGARAAARRDRTTLLVVALAAAETAVVIRAGGDWMGGSRFGVPILCLLAPFAGSRIEERLRQPRHPDRAPGWVAPALLAAGLLYAHVLSPHRPWWEISFATDDRSFVTHGPGPFPAFWVEAADLLDRCAQPGWLVAGSEMGFAPFHHPQLRFLDLRGLVSEDVADAPADLKGTAGVADKRWFEVDSPVGRILLARQPQLILTFDAPDGERPPAVALDGRWSVVAEIPGDAVSEYLYARSDVDACRSG